MELKLGDEEILVLQYLEENNCVRLMCEGQAIL